MDQKQKTDRSSLALLLTNRLYLLSEGPITTAATWRGVAERLGVILFPFHRPGPGCKAELVQRIGRAPVIVFNTAYPDDTQARFLVHELAHYLLTNETDAPAFVVHSYSGATSDEHHQVARLVEHLIFDPRP